MKGIGSCACPECSATCLPGEEGRSCDERLEFASADIYFEEEDVRARPSP